MHTISWSALLLLLSSSSHAFTPFSPTRTVCAACAAPAADKVYFRAGRHARAALHCNVVAENDDFYVLRRFDEYRAARKSDVARVVRTQKATESAIGDQVLLKSGALFHGSIVEQVKARYLVIRSRNFRHTLWLSQIESLHRDGKRVALP